MTTSDALILGLIQGVTEFLPVSSSAHLFLAHRLLGLQEPRLAFDLILHLGTLVAVLYFLRSEITQIVASMFRSRPSLWLPPSDWSRRDIMLIILSSLPTGIIGVMFHDMVESGITFWGVGARYLILSVALLLTRVRFTRKDDPNRIEWWEALLIGVVQGFAVFPGLSRSGSTIIFMLIIGIAPLRAVKYSFLISIPAILGGTLMAMRHGISEISDPMLFVAGFLVAMVSGYIALWLVEHFVSRGRFYYFAPYTVFLSVLCFTMNFYF
ncbi:MAG: undecaprenyl-diphosphate phosphatase [Syntrophorhabdaceae bacterium]|nr:undecaprenyl-diphosphate phosphatase [Syntrophorhabdaceae bacterium]